MDGSYHFLQKKLSKMKFLRVLDVSRDDTETLPLPKITHHCNLYLNIDTINKLACSLAYLYQLHVLEIDTYKS